MTKKLLKIDEEKCVGCGLCASTCQHGVIEIVDGKAKVMREDYCDGLGNCLPVCPTNAISFEEEKQDAAQPVTPPEQQSLACGCPGTASKQISRQKTEIMHSQTECASRLNQWPVQIKLVPVHAPYFDQADLLIAADCTAFAYGNFHNDFIKNRITLIGCPKLDEGDYSEKLAAILLENDIKSITIVRMEVPCCGGLINAVKLALKQSGKLIPWQIVIVATDGALVEN
jgi:ferredoxin